MAKRPPHTPTFPERFPSFCYAYLLPLTLRRPSTESKQTRRCLTLHHGEPTEDPHHGLRRKVTAAGSLVVKDDERLSQDLFVDALDDRHARMHMSPGTR